MLRPHAPVLVLGLALFGCAHAAPPAPAPLTTQARTVVPAVPVVAAAPAPADSIRRSALRSVLAAGPGAFLQKVTLDDNPVFAAGKFHGFRISALQADSFRGVDLKPGDVVTRVEGMPIEHPEEAVEAFYTLQVASELRVDYERDGVARTLRYRIIDDEGPPDPATSSPGGGGSAPTRKKN